MKQSPRGFVPRIDFFTSFGFGEGGEDRARRGIATKGPTRLMTDMAVWAPEPETKELQVVSLHPGVTREAMAASVGWEILYAEDVGETPPPTAEELEILRDLHARTKAAHAGKG